MGGSFFGLNVARSGLFASQRALTVTGHNIANANTPGYSRQRVEIVQSLPTVLPGGQGMLGSGVDTQHISNIRNEFLDYKYWSENQSYGEWNARSGVLETIETIVNEPTDSGIRTVMDQYFAALQELSTKPEDLTVRALVRERGIALSETINLMGSQLEKLQSDLDFEIKTVVDEINGYADQLAKLNEQIFRYELGGNKANDLRDQRTLVLDKLSELVPVDAYEDSQGRMQVMLKGKLLVSHITANHLTTEQRAYGDKNNESDVENLSDVVWADGSAFIADGGKLRGLLDMRDSSSDNNKGVPYYLEKLNHFAKTFAEQVNSIHREGYGIDGTTGIDFFEMDETATSLKVSEAIDLDLNAIAASSTYAGLPGDGSNALKMNQLKDDANMFAWGKPGDFMKSLIANLGVDAQQAIRVSSNQSALLEQTDINRQSVSGVSLDEEMANMVKFQHAYNANARMITTIDEMIDVLVNKMGLVGR